MLKLRLRTNFTKGSTTTGSEYYYDYYGNLIGDLNKKISGIQYNSLYLPTSVTFSTGHSISNEYGGNGVKYRTQYTSGGTTTTTDYCKNVIYENGAVSKILTGEGYITLSGAIPTYHYFLQDHQGNNRMLLNQNGTIEEVNHYYPFGGLFGEGTATANQPYKYNGKELDRMYGLDWYDYGARQYDAALGRFTTVDPMAEKYLGMSSYGYCLNNPIKHVDISGKDVWVKVQANGTYKIVGGSLNSDLNIYTVDANGSRTDNSVGKTLTTNSFFDDKNKVINATINPNDQSGQQFIDNEIIANDPNILSYMPNAVGGEKYDFKTRGIDNRSTNTSKEEYRYRGMPLKDANGNIVYGSARDVGNYGAGYIAGKSGLDWKTARMGFDVLQSYQDGHLSTEGMTTQKAERLGYNAGSQKYWLKNANDWLKRIFR